MTYRDVKADILSKITQGIWAPGSLVPGEIELAELYACARATVNRAMRELADDGYIERRRKSGTRVCMSPVREARFTIPLVRQEIEDSGARYRYDVLSDAVLDAPVWVRERFELGIGSIVRHVACLHYAGDAAYQHEDRWINLAALPQAEQADFSMIGPNEWLVATVPYSKVKIGFSAHFADAALAQHMGCEAGAALFTIERSTWWQGQAVTYVRLSFRPGHRMTAEY